ncbi:hypothetical protein [Aeromicrobium wangtongii]|uniref:hypothetical protein n=1 Tax=Aeromicrobium wangtongii TaxID=2969247 RepID=UPI002017FD5B|nr:hypothetical protein [Aeromicrobium wangtongii]MCL3818031.1 hypothetical protein [Aeromicrobium wangtongii]
MTLTRDEAAAKARHVLAATEVEPFTHDELEGDAVCGGFAFTAGDRGAVIGYDGGYQTSMLELAGETMETLVAGWLVEQRHRHGVPDAPPPLPTHPCPICGQPTVHEDRHPAAVCADCQSRAADHEGRRIVAFNEGIGGGLIVYYAESPTGRQSELAEDVLVTRRCWIDGIECTISEGRFGGVVVERVTPAG